MLDAVTIDAHGTLVELRDPVEPLRAALAARGIERGAAAVRAAFAVEVAHYVPRSHEGRDESTLAVLRRDSARVFLEHLGAALDPGEFAPAFVGALEFGLAEGAADALDALAAAGLTLACIANWDVALAAHLERLGVAGSFAAIVTSAEAGAAKPDPEIFRVALRRLGVLPERALHVGDGEADREGAFAAGLRFAEVPLATLPERLGL